MLHIHRVGREHPPDDRAGLIDPDRADELRVQAHAGEGDRAVRRSARREGGRSGDLLLPGPRRVVEGAHDEGEDQWAEDAHPRGAGDLRFPFSHEPLLLYLYALCASLRPTVVVPGRGRADPVRGIDAPMPEELRIRHTFIKALPFVTKKQCSIDEPGKKSRADPVTLEPRARAPARVGPIDQGSSS